MSKRTLADWLENNAEQRSGLPHWFTINGSDLIFFDHSLQEDSDGVNIGVKGMRLVNNHHTSDEWSISLSHEIPEAIIIEMIESALRNGENNG